MFKCLCWFVAFILSSCLLLAQKSVSPHLIEEATLNVPVIKDAGIAKTLSLRTPTTPQLKPKSEQHACFHASDPLEHLATLFQDTNWRALQEETECILTVQNGFKMHAVAPEKNYYLIVFAAKGYRTDRQVIRYTLHRDSEAYTEDLTAKLPGITDGLFEVFLTTEAPITLLSNYTYTKLDNPLAGQASDFAKQIFEAAIPAAALTQSFLSLTTKQGVKVDVVPVRARMSGVPVSYDRATLEITDIVTIGDTRTVDKIRADITKTQQAIVQREARVSTCAATVNEDLASALGRVMCKSTNLYDKDDKGKTCWELLDDAATAGYARAAGSNQCRTISADDLQVVLAIEGKFKTLVTPADDKELPSVTTKLSNVPLTRYSFGLLTSFIATTRHTQNRAKVDSGNVVRDPLVGNLTMALVNIHPFPYDADADHVTWQERFRWYAGGVLTPNFGFGTGPGLAIVRNFSINAGVAWLVISTPTKDQGFNTAATEKPLKNSVGRAFYVGIGYAFK